MMQEIEIRLWKLPGQFGVNVIRGIFMSTMLIHFIVTAPQSPGPWK